MLPFLDTLAHSKQFSFVTRIIYLMHFLPQHPRNLTCPSKTCNNTPVMFSLLQLVVKMNRSPTPKSGKTCIPSSVNTLFNSMKNFSAFLILFNWLVNPEYCGMKLQKYPTNPKNLATSFPLFNPGQSLIFCTYSGIIQV